MEKLLAIVSLGQSIYARWFFQRLLFSLIVAASLVIIASIMTSAALISGFFIAYQALVHSGTEPRIAAAIVSSALLIITLLLIFFIIKYLSYLRKTPQRMLSEKIPAVSSANEAIEAFIAGLLNEPADPLAK